MTPDQKQARIREINQRMTKVATAYWKKVGNDSLTIVLPSEGDPTP